MINLVLEGARLPSFALDLDGLAGSAKAPDRNTFLSGHGSVPAGNAQASLVRLDNLLRLIDDLRVQHHMNLVVDGCHDGAQRYADLWCRQAATVCLISGVDQIVDKLAHVIVDPMHCLCLLATDRLTEHHVGGAMSRWLPWLSELQPELFAEISEELAAEKGVKNGDWITLWTKRGEVEAKAMVTARIQPLNLKGRTIHQIGLPYHWGYSGVVTGDVANDLLLLVADPNVSMHDAKSFTCNMRAGRRSRQGQDGSDVGREMPVKSYNIKPTRGDL